MIIEWLMSRLTPSQPIYRELGYVNGSIALQKRFERCRKDWSEHIKNCHETILKFVGSEDVKILILGSGPLVEIPYQALLENKKRKLYLLDVVHPREARSIAKKNASQIQLIESDVTGIASLFLKKDYSKIKSLEFSPPPVDFEYDVVISANLVSQLPLDPFGRLQKLKLNWADEDYFMLLSKKMGDDHIKWLKKISKKRLLFTDTERSYFDKKNNTLETLASAYKPLEGSLLSEWQWRISPIGESSKEYGYTMKVECRQI